MVDFEPATWSIFSYMVNFEPATWSIFSYMVVLEKLHGRFYKSYMVDFTPQCNIGQDSIVISYIMDTFSPRKTLYGSIKKATWFLERLRNLLFLILFRFNS